MSSKNLLALLAAVALLALVAVLMSTPEQSNTSANELLLPGLKESLNDVTRVTIKAGNNRTVATLNRRDKNWTVTEQDEYPGDLGKIRQNLIALANARIVEKKTANPDFYNRLGVADIDQPNASGTLVEIEGPEFSASIIIGDTGPGGSMVYARRVGEVQSQMVSAELDLTADTADWLNKDLLDISSGSVHRININHPDGESLRIEKSAPAATDFMVLEIPEGRELSMASVANPIGAALSDLTFEDVVPAADFDPGGVEPVTTQFETFDGLIVKMTAYPVENGIRVGFAFSADEEIATRFQNDATSPDAADGETVEPVESQFNDTVALAESLNTKLGPWIYTLPTYKSDQLVKRLDDLLTPAAG